jgi:glutathionyl-hydroquinone reductase
MIYRGKDIQASDTIRLLNVGFNWIFRDNQTQFTPENVKTIVEKIEE